MNHDGRLFADKEAFLRHARRINDYAREFGCEGFRSGAMYREQGWFDAFEFSYDMSVPNAAHLEMPAVHSIEHLFAEHSRNHSDRVIDFSPMGCQTGFYLILQGEPEYTEVLALIEATMTDILGATEVPAANEVQCGWGANHSLTAAQEAVTVFLAGRAGWPDVTA